MRNILLPILLVMLHCVVGVGVLQAQDLPHRKLLRQGNEAFAEERYERSVDLYKQALRHDSTLFEGLYNVGNAYIKSERWEEAKQKLMVAAADTTRTSEERAAAYYNLGYAQFRQDSLQQSLDSYRRSLVLNSDDMDAKYNYVYVRTLLEQQQNQQNQDQQQNQQNQDQQQNQQNDQNDQNQNDQNNQNNNDKQNDKNNPNQEQGGDNKDNKNDKNDNKDKNSDDKKDNNDNQNNPDKDQNGGNDNNSDKDEREQPEGGQSPSGMSPEQREQMLDAIQAQEDKTQEKVDGEKKKAILIRGKKNW